MEISPFDGCDFQPTTVSRFSSGDNSEICGRSETFHQCPTNVILVAQILNSMGAKNRSQKESHTWDGYWSQTLVLINASVSSCGPGDKLCRSFGKLTHYSVTSYSAVVKRKAHPAARLGRRWAEVASRAAERCSWTGLTRYSDARRTSWRQASGGSQELGEAWYILYSTLWCWNWQMATLKSCRIDSLKWLMNMRGMERERERRDREREVEREDGNCLFNSKGNYTTGGMTMTVSL